MRVTKVVIQCVGQQSQGTETIQNICLNAFLLYQTKNIRMLLFSKRMVPLSLHVIISLNPLKLASFT